MVVHGFRAKTEPGLQAARHHFTLSDGGRRLCRLASPLCGGAIRLDFHLEKSTKVRSSWAMSGPSITQIAGEIISRPGFMNKNLWLTFYMCSGPKELAVIASHLHCLRAMQHDDVESGFFYPKVPIIADPAVIAACVEHVQELASATGVHVLSVDIDTSSDVFCSTFASLVRFDP